MSTTTLEQARAGREQAVQQVDAAADPEWKDIALRAVRYVAQNRKTFISDDVWDCLAWGYPQLEPREPRAIGPVLIRAVKDGICALATCDACGTTKVMTTGRGRTSNAHDTPVYRSLLWRGL